MAGVEHMQDAEREPSAQPSVDVEEDDWDAINAEGTPEADGTQDGGPEESFDTEDEDDEVERASTDRNDATRTSDHSTQHNGC